MATGITKIHTGMNDNKNSLEFSTGTTILYRYDTREKALENPTGITKERYRYEQQKLRNFWETILQPQLLYKTHF